ncbi:MAG: glutamate synthase subunit beta [Bacteroidota bacterium]
MDQKKAFFDINRQPPPKEHPQKRVKHSKEFSPTFTEGQAQSQSSRCLDCGIPFCHQGCPLGNHIPQFNQAVANKDWKQAFQILDQTNNFPEFTGRVCPAPCEQSCVLNIYQDAVTIEEIEKAIVEEAFAQGWIKPKKSETRTGKKVAVIGSGPAGLAAAEELNLKGHWVTVFEKDAKPGGLLRYGIPDFKLEKWVVDRRIRLMQEAGIDFKCRMEVGKDVTAAQLKQRFDAIIMCIGAPVPRDMELPGRDLTGVELAMDYLYQQNQWISGEKKQAALTAKDKHVIVIGGGDTGSDCIGTAHRQGAQSVTQVTWGLQPPIQRTTENPWPEWAKVLDTSSSQEEGCHRMWNVLAKAFIGNGQGELVALRVVTIEWTEGRKAYREVPDSERDLPCGLALMAIGFQSTKTEGLVKQLGLETQMGKIVADKRFQGSTEGVFVAGDARRGASLLVWAIREGRDAAYACDEYLGRKVVAEVEMDLWEV